MASYMASFNKMCDTVAKESGKAAKTMKMESQLYGLKQKLRKLKEEMGVAVYEDRISNNGANIHSIIEAAVAECDKVQCKIDIMKADQNALQGKENQTQGDMYAAAPGGGDNMYAQPPPAATQ